MEALNQSLAAEVAPFGIRVTLIEPAGYATDWGGPSAQRASRMPVYEEAHAAMRRFRAGNIPGDPEATGPAILKLVDSADPPLRVFFGSAGLPLTRAEYASRLELWEKWDFLSLEAQGDWATKHRQPGSSAAP